VISVHVTVRKNSRFETNQLSVWNTLTETATLYGAWKHIELAEDMLSVFQAPNLTDFHPPHSIYCDPHTISQFGRGFDRSFRCRQEEGQI